MGNQKSIEQARSAYRRRLRIGAAIMLGGIVAFFALVVFAWVWFVTNGVDGLLQRFFGVAA